MKKLPFHLVFFLMIGIMSVMNLLKPKDEFSIRENRTLQTAPSFTFAAFQNKSYQTSFEQAGNDQFYLRDGFIKLQRDFITHLGIKQIGQVLIGENQLFQVPESIDSSMIDSLIKELNAFAATHQKLHYDVLLVPTQSLILQDEGLHPLSLKELAHRNRVIAALSSQFDCLDTITPLEQHKHEYIYYKGDHHWTTLGAYTIFQAWRNEHQLKEKEKYEPMIINDAFYGTLSNQSGVELKDQVELYVPKSESVKTIVTYVEEQEKTTTIYDVKKQYSANPYEIFFGGNHARIDIETTSKEHNNLLLIKDSYANSMISFLLPYYHSITVIDPRYFYDSLSSIIKERAITDVMLLYNTNTFFTDSSLLHLLQEE